MANYQKCNNKDMMEVIENTPNPEQRLWKAVLAQAMYDLLSDNLDVEEDGHRMLAECWITNKHKDFVDVCRNAGFDPDYIHSKAHKLLKTKKLKQSGIVWNYKKRERNEQKDNLS